MFEEIMPLDWEPNQKKNERISADAARARELSERNNCNLQRYFRKADPAAIYRAVQVVFNRSRAAHV